MFAVKSVEGTELFDNTIVLFLASGSRSLRSVALAIACYLAAIHLIIKGEETE